MQTTAYLGLAGLAVATVTAAGSSRERVSPKPAGTIDAVDVTFVEEVVPLSPRLRLRSGGTRPVLKTHVSTMPRPNPGSTARLNPTTGVQSTVVILVNTAANPVEPLTAQEVSDWVFGTQPSALDTWVRRVSFDQAQVAGAVVGWYTLDIPESDLCTDVGLQAALAAANPNVYFPDYLRLILVYPYTAACPGGGTGSWGLRTGLVTEDEGGYGPVDLSLVTLNGAANFGTGLLEHEFGHNLGLLHATDWECGGASIGSDETCEAIPYSDQFDVMGTYATRGHFNAAHLDALGWLAPGEVVIATEPGRYTLAPLESTAGGVKALKIPTPDGRSYYVEYRRPDGYDQEAWTLGQQELGVDVFRGPMIRIARFLPNPVTGASDTQMLDLSPHADVDQAAQQLDSLDAVLAPGQWFFDSANGVAILTIAATSTEVVVYVGNQPGVPTTSQWGVAVLALLLLCGGVVVQRGRAQEPAGTRRHSNRTSSRLSRSVARRLNSA